MESKRRHISNSTDEGPRRKRNCALTADNDITIEQGIEIKSEEDDDEGIHFSNHESDSVDHFYDRVKNESVDVKNEPEDVKDESMSKDEKLVAFEVPVESDDVDPLRPLKVNVEVKDDPTNETVKIENCEVFEENSESSGLTSPAEDVKIKPQGRDDTQPPLTDMSHNVSLQEQRNNPAFKNNTLEKGKASKHQTSLPWVTQKSSNSGPQIILSRQEENSELASGSNVLQTFNVGIDYPLQDIEFRDQREPHGLYARPQFGELQRQPSSKPSSHAEPDNDSNNENIILQLLAQNQKYRTKEEEDMIIQTGRPTPLIRIRYPRDINKGFWVTARDYHRIPWLTGLERLQKYYCWPCLLFTKERWTVSGGAKQIKFWEAVNQHTSTPLHQVAYKNLKLRESQLADAKHNWSNPNHIVKTNRNFLALLIRILCFKKSELHNTDLNFHGFEELMNVAISYKPELLQSAGKPISKDGLIGFVSRHALKLLPSIEAKIAVRISNEFRRSQFVSLVYEDTENTVHGSSLMAVIARFLTDDGDISERFLKFVVIGRSRNAQDIFETHLAVTTELGVRMKLVGFTFSGTVVAPTSIEEFISSVSKYSPRARFFHHPDHNLKEILFQSLSHIQGCQSFLKAVSDVVKFLNNSGTVPKLVNFVKHNKATCQRFDDARSFTIDIISTFRKYYPLIVKFFINVSQESWDDEFAKQAANFAKFLQEPLSRYLIVVIATVLDAVDDLSKVMEKNYDAAEWMTQADKVLCKLAEFGKNGVSGMYSVFKSQAPEEFARIDTDLFRNIFREIIETAKICVFHRARNSDTFYINSKYSEPTDILRAPELWNRYGMPFGSFSEFGDHIDHINVFNTMFNKKSIPEIVKAVANIQTSNPNLNYLKTPKFQVWRSFVRFCAMGTSPMKSTSALSPMLRLKFYLKNKHEFNPTEAIMFLEKDIIRSQMGNAEFIEEIITHYAKKNRAHNFLHDSPGPCELEVAKITLEDDQIIKFLGLM